MGGGPACRRFQSARHHARTRFRGDRSSSDLVNPHFIRGQATIKELVEIHLFLTGSLFGSGIPRRLFLRVSLTKLTSVALPSRQLRKTKPQFASRRQPFPRERHHEAGAVRRRTTVLQTFRPALLRKKLRLAESWERKPNAALLAINQHYNRR